MTNKTSLDVLATMHRRPSSEEALALEDEHILESAVKLGLPLNQKAFETIAKVHEHAMPLVENILTGLLKAEEKHTPDYYPLARDGEMLYDALWGLGNISGSTLQKRLSYVKTSNSMRYEYKKTTNPEYFKSLGISSERIVNGPRMVFLDSGFQGSLFFAIADWVGIMDPRSSIPNDNFAGYLVRKSGSNFQQLEFIGPKKYAEFMKALKCDQYNEIIYGEEGENLNWNLCAYLQMMPKFTGRFVQTCEIDGKWDVLPQKNSFVSGKPIEKATTNDRCVGKNDDQVNSIDKNLTWVNADVVDPVASLLLQRKTLNYFSDPNVQDRVYSGGKIKVK